jgi:hypothetical protein
MCLFCDPVPLGYPDYAPGWFCVAVSVVGLCLTVWMAFKMWRSR